MSHSYKTILKKIILKLGFGFKKDRIEACLGEEIPLQLDEKLFEGNVKANKTKNRKNSFSRWLKQDSLELTDSKTIQDDQGNTYTRTSLDGTLNFITENNSEDPNSSAVHSLEAKGGRPINRLLIPNKQLVDSYIDNKDYSYNIFLNDIENKGLAATCFRINRKGNVSHPYQYRALAILETSTGRVTGAGESYKHGSSVALRILKDVGDQFYGGDGAGKPATLSVYEDNTYQVYMHITFNSFEDKPGELLDRVTSQSGRIYNGRGILAGGVGNNSVGLLFGIDAIMGDIFEFSTSAFLNPYERRVSFTGSRFPVFTTYIGVYCLG